MASVTPAQLPSPMPLPRLPRPLPSLAASALALADLIAVAVAGTLALWLRTRLLGPLNPQPYLLMAPGLLLYSLTFAHAGLYPGYGLGEVEKVRRVTNMATLVTLILAAATFLFKSTDQISRLVLLFTWLLVLVLVPILHGVTQSLLSRAAWWGLPALVLGAAQTGQLVIQKLNHNPQLGLRPVACLDDDPAKTGRSCAGVPVVGPLRLAPALARQHRILVAVVAMPGLSHSRLTQVLETHVGAFRQVLIIPDLLGLNSLWVSARDLGGVLGLELRQNLLDWRNQVLKRTLDLALGIALLLLAAPVILLAGLLVKLLSPGPAFYAQEREGLGGRRIRVWKIRTMVPNAEAALREYLAAHPAARQEWEQHMKLRHDPRVVPLVGQWLRRLSLDELPQLWNVIRGEMSLVGPRPFPEYHLQRFSPSFRSLRHRVLPGITGLWQVTARSEGNLAVQEELDTYYIRNWSLWLDVYILARTLTAVLARRGAY